jgi:hypothetical protein
MIERFRPARRVLLLAALATAVPASAASAVPVSVNLRVEGATQTLFEGPVTTDGHDVTTAAGGTHACDGTLVEGNTGPSPTATSALDDTARQHGFSIDGIYSVASNDFFISRVGSDAVDPSSQYWSLYVNWDYASLGGCGQQVHAGDEVLWAFAGFDVSQALRLEGPTQAHVGQAVTVTTKAYPGGTPQAGASVNGTLTGADGTATLTFATPGVYRLKAEREGQLRSNALPLCIDPPDADPCTAGDRTAPVAQVKLPGGGGGLASADSRSRTVVIAWQGQDLAADGSGVATFTAEAREITPGASPSQVAAPWRTLLWRSKETSVRFRGHAGRAYEFRVTAYDRAANASTPASGTLAFPVDDRNRRILHLSRGDWSASKHADAFGGRVVRSRHAGASAWLAFNGTQVALIGRKIQGGGRLRISVDGKARVLKLAGRSGFRQTLYTSPTLKAGAHELRLKALGGGPVELDAVAPLP